MNPHGRPTHYTEEIAAQAWQYIEDYESHGHTVPSLVGLCKVLNRGKSTLYDWAKLYPDFADIISAINEYQELVTINKSLTGEFNSTMSKLLLGKHGYHDKQDVDQSVNGNVKHSVEWTVQPVKPVNEV